MAIASEFGRGFTSNGRTSTVSIFDLKTLKVIGQVPVGKNPDSIRYDPLSKKVFTFNGQSHDASVIDAATGKVVATIPLGGKPEFSVTDGKGRVYVNNEDKSEIDVIDSRTLKVVATMADCSRRGSDRTCHGYQESSSIFSLLAISL